MWSAAEYHCHRSVLVSIHCLSIIKKNSSVVKIIPFFILYSDLPRMKVQNHKLYLMIWQHVIACLLSFVV